MAIDAPSDVIPFFPQKIRRTKVHLYLVRSLKAYRSVHIVFHARHVDPHKGVRQATAVVSEEERAGAELVSATDNVSRRNLKKSTEPSSS